ncbi:D-alanyl-lipoteichoic acid acyltransferase DltB (MBOAT superfamily) [Gillisia mitskevichiae]|uniref:D-alanyl-lipoteichoic acid acyltransferase DltB (MBOAT superfamily) n=1 Tax=Gillisia mitskevichiae TaxID=270921 RepID=A0A495PL82_9FLAO|nr:MBOAT family O-acyltransferase [Gillisia mitskevichiae]RKS50610.1 D-alanyl-lipoteichoic acid acyltransferase DltB (MBOAT superfamily) [Gillisia mitskevichiae]
MLFNSLDFTVFLPIVFVLYWFVVNKNLKHQNILIAFASYVFYGWWDWRFLALILFSTLVDYVIGVSLGREHNLYKRKILLWVSVLVNLGFLGFFKYYNFFLDNFKSAFTFFGSEINANSLNIILPVGISFYTFQTLSYTIDVYKRQLEPTKDFISFAAFVSFFPQLVAGPIERATNLLPQFNIKRKFNYTQGVDGMRLILWGMFKKVVIADNCAFAVNDIFANYGTASGMELILGAIFFAFQIYGDFSGYSDMAIGTAKLFGFDLMINFRTPYFSRDIAEFWRRWHISLSTWFRDYVYIPLGGSRVSKNRGVINIFVVFMLSGFWHGANWTFVVWGSLNALYFLPLLLSGRNRKDLGSVAEGRTLPNFKELVQMVLTFSFTCLAWVFFRSDTVADAINYIFRIFVFTSFNTSALLSHAKIITLISIFLLFEWRGRADRFPLYFKNSILRRLSYATILLLIVFFGLYISPNSFIYFQF